MKKRNMKKLNNEGYSLIEMIIVIAIIAVFTGASIATISIMHSARAKEAAITFDSELAELVNNSKNMACDANVDGVIDASDDGYSFGLRVHKNNGKCFVQTVLVDDNGLYVYDDSFEKANNPNDGKGISLSPYVYVTYRDNSGTVRNVGSNDDAVLIHFRKNGSCDIGYGTFEFIKKSNEKMVSKVTINKNGSHQSK